jgi:hypothetical protein
MDIEKEGNSSESDTLDSEEEIVEVDPDTEQTRAQ